MAKVPFDGLHRYHEPLRNLSVGETLRGERCDLTLPLCKCFPTVKRGTARSGSRRVRLAYRSAHQRVGAAPLRDVEALAQDLHCIATLAMASQRSAEVDHGRGALEGRLRWADHLDGRFENLQSRGRSAH